MIRIIKGTYGLYQNGFVTPITAKDGPISIDPRREAELVEAGIAEKVTEKTATDETREEFELSEKYLKRLNVTELKELAEQRFGIQHEPGMRKADFIRVILEESDEKADYGELIEEVEEDGEETPILDAEEAVQ